MGRTHGASNVPARGTVGDHDPLRGCITHPTTHTHSDLPGERARRREKEDRARRKKIQLFTFTIVPKLCDCVKTKAISQGCRLKP